MLIKLKRWEVTQRRPLQRLGAAFANWTTDGLSVLAETAGKQVDGPLGWTSKPEVFAIGMRVILAARVVLSLCDVGITEDVQKSCKKRLEELLEVGSQADLHGFWISEVEDILGSSELSAQDVTRC